MALPGVALALALTLGALAPTAQAAPRRVVSINLCTDQLAMLLARPDQLVAISDIARDPVASAMWREAEAYPAITGGAEEIKLLAPDLVLAGDYSPASTVNLLRRLGIPIETFAIEESFEDIRASILRMGELLGTQGRAEALIAAMDETLAAPISAEPRPRALLYYANGYTSGAQTLADEVLRAAGYANVAAEQGLTGLAHLPLELLVLDDPDLLILGQDYASPALAQRILRHPALEGLRAERTRIADNLWTCGTPLVAEAVADLRAARPE